ncbi:MAG: hypothetical protein WA896_05320 [Spirulinaceae cyanobacterium]
MPHEQLIEEWQKMARDSIMLLRRLLIISLLKTVSYCILSLFLFSVAAAIIFHVSFEGAGSFSFAAFFKLVALIILYLIAGIICGVSLAVLSGYQNLVSKTLHHCLQPLFSLVIEAIFEQKESMNIYFFQQGLNQLVVEISGVLEETFTNMERTIKTPIKIFTIFKKFGIRVFHLQSSLLIYLNQLMLDLTVNKLLKPFKKEGRTDINIVEVGQFITEQLPPLIEEAASKKIKTYRRFVYIIAGSFLFAPIAITALN